MRWSWRIGTLAGIGIYVHYTFLILMGWVLLSYGFSGTGLLQALGAVGFVAVVFGFVLMHELGHALTAKGFGIGTRDITLLPIGGIANIQGSPRTPGQELLISLAGPAVNFALAAFLSLASLPIFGLNYFFNGTWQVSDILARLIGINLMLGTFNLLPAFPMDGGRVFRAVLSWRLGHVRATGIAALTGKVLAAGMGVVGLFYNPFLAGIAVFIWMAASAEDRAVRHGAHTSPWHTGRVGGYFGDDGKHGLKFARAYTYNGEHQRDGGRVVSHVYRN